MDHRPQLALLEKARRIPGVKKIMIASGIRYDLIPADIAYGKAYVRELTRYHVSGQLRVAPEHDSPKVLAAMGKPGKSALLAFKDEFERETKAAGLPQYLSYYFIACHPGCTERDMAGLKKFCQETLHVTPEQAQIFTPTPSTWSATMYYTERHPDSGEHVFVEKDPARKQKQKDILTQKTEPAERRAKPDPRRRNGRGGRSGNSLSGERAVQVRDGKARVPRKEKRGGSAPESR